MNKQMTEDYVSYEIAVFLKEKKFGWKCNTVYLEFEDGRVELRYEDKALYQEQTKVRYCVPALLAPSLYNVMKWLREMHNIETSISYGFPFIDGKQVFKYYWCPVKVTEKGLEYPMDDPNTAEFNEEMADSYEEAVEAALKYTLENLI